MKEGAQRAQRAPKGTKGSLAEVAKQLIWGADRIDRIDSKSMQPSETLGLLAIFMPNKEEYYE